VDHGVVVDVKLSDVAGDFWRESNGVTVGVGIGGTLEIPHHHPVGNTSDDCDDYNDPQTNRGQRRRGLLSWSRSSRVDSDPV
jgi:hypothetical protein